MKEEKKEEGDLPEVEVFSPSEGKPSTAGDLVASESRPKGRSRMTRRGSRIFPMSCSLRGSKLFRLVFLVQPSSLSPQRADRRVAVE